MYGQAPTHTPWEYREILHTGNHHQDERQLFWRKNIYLLFRHFWNIYLIPPARDNPIHLSNLIPRWCFGQIQDLVLTNSSSNIPSSTTDVSLFITAFRICQVFSTLKRLAPLKYDTDGVHQLNKQSLLESRECETWNHPNHFSLASRSEVKLALCICHEHVYYLNLTYAKNYSKNSYYLYSL